jgi:aryl-alcohol dehydrogenase-like predicted oxidoreductase
MNRRQRFGGADPPLSQIGFGCGGFWGLPVFPEKRARVLLRHGLENGITFVDTGPNYSGGHAEARLGRITNGDYKGVLLATKVGSRLLETGRVVRDFTPEGMEASLRDSLRRLRADHVDLLQLHGPPLSALDDEKVLGTLEGFVKRGLIVHKGVSADGSVADRVARLPFFDTLMTTYNVVEQGGDGTMKTAQMNGQTVLAKSPLAHHVFGTELYQVTSLAKLWYLLRVLKNYRRQLWRGRKLHLTECMKGWTPTEVALRFVLDHPAVSSAVVGTTNLDHLKQNLGVLSKGRLSEQVLASIAHRGSRTLGAGS